MRWSSDSSGACWGMTGRHVPFVTVVINLPNDYPGPTYSGLFRLHASTTTSCLPPVSRPNPYSFSVHSMSPRPKRRRVNVPLCNYVNFGPPFDDSDADVILRSGFTPVPAPGSTGVVATDFLVHKLFLEKCLLSSRVCSLQVPKPWTNRRLKP